MNNISHLLSKLYWLYCDWKRSSKKEKKMYNNSFMQKLLKCPDKRHCDTWCHLISIYNIMWKWNVSYLLTNLMGSVDSLSFSSAWVIWLRVTSSLLLTFPERLSNSEIKMNIFFMVPLSETLSNDNFFPVRLSLYSSHRKLEAEKKLNKIKHFFLKKPDHAQENTRVGLVAPTF